MQIWELIAILAGLFSATAVFIWLLSKSPKKKAKNKIKEVKANKNATAQDYLEAAEEDVEHIFNNEFREELRNRARLQFEKIMTDNAMFLQQDLRLTTSELNQSMKSDMAKNLELEFKKYEESINDAKRLAIESIEKTRQAIDQQREFLGEQLQEQVAAEKTQHIARFEENMADIINHYVLKAAAGQLDIEAQLGFILKDLEVNKTAIIEDLKNASE